MMTLDEAIKHCEEVAELNEECARIYNEQGETMASYSCNECAEEHRQLAEWMKELKERRKIQDILLQLLVDFDLDICCDDLMDDEEEQKICEENCNSHTKGCWIRWAKMKAEEVKTDE